MAPPLTPPGMGGYIAEFDFTKEYTLSAGLTVRRGVVSIAYSANPSAGAPGQKARVYGLGLEMVARTKAFSPGILRGWGFIELIGSVSFVDGDQVSFLDVRIHDGTESLFWDGAAWTTAGATDFNTISEVNANLSAFAGTSIRFEVRLRTEDPQRTPTLQAVRLKWNGKKISFLREWVVDTVLRSIRDSIRPVSDFPVRSLGGLTIPFDGSAEDSSWQIVDVEEVYDHEEDPSHLVNLLDSYDSGSGTITLVSEIASGNVAFVRARYAPQAAVTTSSDYLSGGASPAILITEVRPSISKSIGVTGPHVIDTSSAVPAGTVYPHAIKMLDIEFSFATIAPTSADLIVLNEAVSSWIEAHPVLRSASLDLEVRMTPGPVLEWNTAQDDVSDPRVGTGSFGLRDVPIVSDSSAGAADGGASKTVGSVDAGDPAFPGVGFGVSNANLTYEAFDGPGPSPDSPHPIGEIDCTITCASAISTAVASATAPLQAEIDALQIELEAALEAGDPELVASLQAQVADLTAQVAALEAQADVDAATIDNLNSQITALNAQIDALNDQITALNTQVSEQADEIAVLEGQISTLNDQITALNDQITQLEADVIAAFAAGANSIQPAWRNPGLLDFAGTAPTAYGSAYVSHSSDSNGSVTVQFTGGTAGSLPSNGIALVWRARDIVGRDLTARDWQHVVLRMLAGAAQIPTNVRVGVAILKGPNPATAGGWGIFGQGSGGSALAGAWYNTGSWTSVVASVVHGGSIYEGVVSQYKSGTGPTLVVAKLDGAGLAGVNTTNALIDTSPPYFDFTGGADPHIALVVGQVGSSVADGAVTLRGMYGVLGVDPADFLGAA